MEQLLASVGLKTSQQLTQALQKMMEDKINQAIQQSVMPTTAVEKEGECILIETLIQQDTELNNNSNANSANTSGELQELELLQCSLDSRMANRRVDSTTSHTTAVQFVPILDKVSVSTDSLEPQRGSVLTDLTDP